MIKHKLDRVILLVLLQILAAQCKQVQHAHFNQVYRRQDPDEYYMEESHDKGFMNEFDEILRDPDLVGLEPNNVHYTQRSPERVQIKVSSVRPPRETIASGNIEPEFDPFRAVTQTAGVDCGTIDADRIIGGDLINVYEAPWHTLVIAGETAELGYVCAGSILSPWYVVTSAFCIFEADPQFSGVLYGRSHLPNDTLSGNATHWRDAQALVAHESFEVNNTMLFDIGVVKVETVFEFTGGVFPICLPAADFCLEEGIPMEVFGWGEDDPYGEEDVYKRKKRQVGLEENAPLKRASVKIEKLEDCLWIMKSEVSEDDFIDDTNICAGGYEGDTDACWGDSGGALAWQDNDGIYYIGGIASWSVGCGDEMFPTIYTRVSKYLNWIKEKIDIKPDGPTNPAEHECFDLETKLSSGMAVPDDFGNDEIPFTADGASDSKFHIIGRGHSVDAFIQSPAEEWCLLKDEEEKSFRKGTKMRMGPCGTDLTFQWNHNKDNGQISSSGYVDKFCLDTDNKDTTAILQICSPTDNVTISQQWTYNGDLGLLANLNTGKLLSYDSRLNKRTALYKYVPNMWGENYYTDAQALMTPTGHQVTWRSGQTDFIENIGGFKTPYPQFNKTLRYCVRTEIEGELKSGSKLFMKECPDDVDDFDRSWRLHAKVTKQHLLKGQIKSTDTTHNKHKQLCWSAGGKLNNPSNVNVVKCSRKKNQKWEYDRVTGVIFLAKAASVMSRSWCLMVDNVNTKMRVEDCQHFSFGLVR